MLSNVEVLGALKYLERHRCEDVHLNKNGNLEWYWNGKWYQLSKAGWLRSRKACTYYPKTRAQIGCVKECQQRQYGIARLTTVADFVLRWEALTARSIEREVP